MTCFQRGYFQNCVHWVCTKICIHLRLLTLWWPTRNKTRDRYRVMCIIRRCARLGGGMVVGIKTKMTIILQRQNFQVLEWLPKKGNIFKGSPKVRSGHVIGIIPGMSLLSFNLSIVSDIWVFLSTLTFQVRYALYGACNGGRLEKATLWDHTMVFGRGYKRKLPPTIE